MVIQKSKMNGRDDDKRENFWTKIADRKEVHIERNGTR